MKNVTIEVIVKSFEDSREAKKTALEALLKDVFEADLREVLENIFKNDPIRFKKIIGGCHGIMYKKLNFTGF